MKIKIGEEVKIMRRGLPGCFLHKESNVKVHIYKSGEVAYGYLTGIYKRKGCKDNPYVVQVGDHEFMCQSHEVKKL